MFSVRFKALREAHGDSQAAIAEKCGVSQKTVSRWEMGEQIPRGDELCAVAEVYNVTTDYLLGRSPLPNVYAHIIGTIDGQEATFYSSQKPTLNEEEKAGLIAAAQSPGTVSINKPDNLPKDRQELVSLVKQLIAEARQNAAKSNQD